MFGLHLGIDGAVTYKAADPRVDKAMIVFCGLETEDELHAHLRRVDAGQERECHWVHATVPTRFDATMAPPGHQVLRAEAVVQYGPSWTTEGPAFGDSCLKLLSEYADIDEIVL